MNLNKHGLYGIRFSGIHITAVGALLYVFALICAPPCSAASDRTGGRTQTEIIRLGERMYRDGILPSGKPMDAVIRNDVEVDSSAFSCSSCHLRAGLGSFEGGVSTPPTTGNKLYKPYYRPPSLGDTRDSAGRFIYAKTVTQRPAYTRENLADAIRFGVDSAGQPFNDVMPRYPLADGDMEILISYLDLLSSAPSPGASSDAFRFATIITDDVSQEDRQALLLPLRAFIENKNLQNQMYDEFIKTGFSPTIDMIHAFRQASLDIWALKGSPETWQSQLAAYYAKGPVFAVLGGISNRDWKPIHEFCEAKRLPCLFPITNFPVVSETDWYTYYFNKGYAQEGEAAAHYLNRMEKLAPETPILQIVQDSPVGKVLAAGFQSAWGEFERPAVKSLTLTSGQLLDQAAMKKLLATHKPGVLVLWTDAALLPKLPALVSSITAPKVVLMSSGYLGKKTISIPDAVRDTVYITYPYRLTPYVGTKDGGIDAKVPILPNAKELGDLRITSRITAILTQVVLRGLYLLYDNLYQDHLLDIISTQMDTTVRDFERFSFGPGQRYVSKGCYIIQLGPGTDPALLQRSDWVIH